MAFSWFRVAVPLLFAFFSVVVAIIGQHPAMPPPLPAALGVCSLAGMALIWRDIRSKMKGENRTLSSLLSQYLAVKGVGWLGRRQRRKLEADTLNVKQVQEETLLKRLRKNAGTCYGSQYDFSSIKDSDGFRARHPITTYEHYSELIRRIAAGEEKVIIAEKPLILAMTSGTSGPSAMLLSTKDTNTEFFLQGVTVCLDAMRRAFPATDSLQRTTKFFYSPTFRQSEAGIPIGPNSSTPASSRHMLNLYTTPAPAFEVPSEKDTLYLHLLFALKDPSVGTLESNFASTVFYAFSALQDRWQELVEDIERGKVSSALALEPKVRSRLDALMKPDPKRATELRAHFQDGFRGIAKRLWPHLHLVLAVDSGSNQIYGEMLRENYCQGVPFYSPFYAATEGLIGVNLWPQEPNRRYMLCPRSMFCEFLPESSLEDETPHTLLMEEVKEGQNYELVITNASGLFRYRIGDIVKVVGFHNQCPIVEFQYRQGQMLSVRGEKVSEALFLDALKKAVSQWPGAQLVDYCCAESGIMGDSIGGSDPHYQVFIELKGVRNLTEEQRYKLDICLQQDSAVYKSFRIKGSIGPMRVQLVAEGAFKELRKHMMAFSNTSPNTFKMHRVLRRNRNVTVPLRNLLNSIQCIRDRVRDGESNESDGAFNLSNFWDTLNQAVKAVSQEATKLSLAFSKPPLPSQQDVEKLADSFLKSVLTLSTVYYWLPKSQGVSLRRQVRDATVEVLEGVAQLAEVILSSPLQSLTQEQLTSTGGVWSACDQFAQLPQDNKAAVLVVLSAQIGVVKDAIEEIEQKDYCTPTQALSEADDPFSDVLDDDQEGGEPRGNQDTYWSETDRRVIGPCQGLMKASAACLRKLTSAIKAHGDVTTPQNLAQLDDLADITKEISPGVDDLALCLYPPMDYSGVETNVSKLAALLKKVLEIIRSSHVCGESQLTWVQFLDGAVDHNLQKAKDLIQQDS